MDNRRIGIRFQVETRDFYLLHSIQIGSIAHPASHPTDIRAPFPGDKVAGTPSSSAEVKTARSYTSTLPYVFME
jgi:hypothetical protein